MRIEQGEVAGRTKGKWVVKVVVAFTLTQQPRLNPLAVSRPTDGFQGPNSTTPNGV